MPKSLQHLRHLGRRIAGSGYDKWLDRSLFSAFTSDADPSVYPPITRGHLVEQQFPHPQAMARLDRVCRKFHIRNPSHLARIRGSSLGNVTGVGDKTLLAACAVLEAYGTDATDISRWIETIGHEPHRSMRAAAADAARKGKKKGGHE